jgi:hypothetical protein
MPMILFILIPEITTHHIYEETILCFFVAIAEQYGL